MSFHVMIVGLQMLFAHFLFQKHPQDIVLPVSSERGSLDLSHYKPRGRYSYSPHFPDYEGFIFVAVSTNRQQTEISR